MPEIVEVEKLRKQLAPAWEGRRVAKFSAPPTSPSPKKYAQDGWEIFSATVRAQSITKLERVGKALLVMLEEPIMWHIHLNSTGWWMPGNNPAARAALIDPIHQNFLHTVDEKNVRVKMELDDGQLWYYHDSRTWGKWYLRPGRTPRDNEYLASYGPDWFSEEDAAIKAIRTYRSGRTVKDVLCDQKVTAGIGNYLSCEAAFHAEIHPHTVWNRLSEGQKARLADEIRKLLWQSLNSKDHEHWAVFDRKGQPCPKHNAQGILYVKDRGDARGSYYCPLCQGDPVT